MVGSTSVLLALLLFPVPFQDEAESMITSIHYLDGRSQLGILMSLAPSIMRLAIFGCDDAAVFTRRNGQWFSELNEPAEIVFNAADEVEHDYCLLLQDLSESEEVLTFVAIPAAMTMTSVQ